VDLRRPGHVTLPPLQTVATVVAPAAYTYTARQPSISITGSDVGSLLNHAGFGGCIYSSADAGASWTKRATITNAYMVARILEFGGGGTATLYGFPEGTGGAAAYVKSTNGTSWAAAGAGATKIWEDATIWSAYGQDIIIGTTPIAKIGYTEDGENWNVDDADPDVAAPIWQANYGRIQFVGTYMAPWGSPAVYFLARNDAGLQSLFVLDFYAHQAYAIDVGNKMHLHDALIWNGAIVVTDGWSVKLYNPGSQEIVRDISFPRKGGMCPTLAGGVIVKLIGGNDYLYAVLYKHDGASQIICYNGAGWSTLGPEVATFASVVCGIASAWQPATVATTRRIVMLGGTTFAAAATSKTVTMPLPAAGEVPVVGTDSFQDGPLSYITGWIDGGFHEIDGTLYWMKIDAFGLTGDQTVKVEYQLDNAESSSWVQLVDSANAAMVYDALTDVGYFSATTPKKGIKFRTVRFRITLDRGGSATTTPELIALILLFDKKPALREVWPLRIDVNRMIEASTTYTNGGSPWTVAAVWAKLRDLWNTYPLLDFAVPNIRTGMYVKIADMVGSFDDFRNAVDGKGHVDITILEPVDA
jgi:hypothetical protein